MINSIDLRTLRNAEFIRFGIDLSAIVVVNDPVALNIEPQFLTFTTRLTETSGLFRLAQSNPITQELVLLDERRDKAITGINSAIESFCYHFDPDTSRAANLLVTNLSIYGKGIAKQNLPTESTTIDAIITDWGTKPELVAAITKLGLNSWVSELQDANQLFEQRYVARTLEYGAATPDTIKAKRNETMEAYYVLRDFINASAIIKPGAAIDKLITDLNASIYLFNTLLNKRLTEPEVETDTDPVPAPI